MSTTMERQRMARLLIVEDDESQLRTLTTIMENEHFEVISCTTATEALEHVQCEDFGVAIVDLKLPDLSGTELIDKIHTMKDSVRVIINTGYGSFDSAKEALNLGAFAYVEKLGDPGELVRAVHRAHRDHLDEYTRNLEADVARRTATLLEVQAEQNRLREELHQAQKMEAIGQMADGVAHGFNNLLMVILANCECLRDRLTGNADAISVLEMIEQAANQATGVTRSLLTFSRRMPAKKEPADLCTVVANSVRMLRQTLPAGIEFKSNVPTDREFWVNADASQLQQVILNLAINARDAMPHGGTLTVSVFGVPHGGREVAPDGPRSVRLTISDTGTGMSQRVRERIFEPFFTTKPREQGTGLGLSIVHGIVMQHEGSIRVDTKVGEGTTFFIDLPRTKAPSVVKETRLPRSLPPGNGIRVLLAEDDDLVRSIILSALRANGHEVTSVADGTALSDAFKREEHDIKLFVLEANLPKRSAISFLHDVRAKGVTIPAIVISQDVEEEIDFQLDERTVMLPKPFQIAELGAVVREVLGSKSDSLEPTQRG